MEFHSVKTNRIAGDFLGLLKENDLLPAQANHGGALENAVHSTTVFGVQFKDGILMAGDRRATAGNQIVTETVDKILEIDASSILAIAGAPATAFEMARTLQTSFEYYRRSQLQPMSLAAKVRALAGLLRNNLSLSLQGVGAVVPLFAGLETQSGEVRPRLFFYDLMGAQFQAANFAASGSGSAVIKSILRYQEKSMRPAPTSMSRKQALQLSLTVLNIAAEFDSATGGVHPASGQFATIKILTPKGIESVSESEQKEQAS